MSQITLLTGPERRRRWSEAAKAAILAEAFAGGGCVADVARRHEVSTGLIYTWRRKAQADRAPGFVEAVVAQSPPTFDRGGTPAILVDTGAMRVSIAGSASPALVSAVLRALR